MRDVQTGARLTVKESCLFHMANSPSLAVILMYDELFSMRTPERLKGRETLTKNPTHIKTSLHEHFCKSNKSREYLRLTVDTDGAIGELHHRPVQLHRDAADGRLVLHHLSSHLNVEVLIVAPTQRGEDIVTRGRQLEDVAVESLEVIVTPRATDLFIMSRDHCHEEEFDHRNITAHVITTTTRFCI